MINVKMNMIHLYKLLLIVLLAATVSAVHVQINNLHTGKRLVLEGKAGRDNNNLLINPVQIIENSLTPTNPLNFIRFYGHKIQLDVNKLARKYSLKNNFSPVITTYWIQNNQIIITFKFSETNNVHQEDLQQLYDFIKSATNHPNTHPQMIQL